MPMIPRTCFAMTGALALAAALSVAPLIAQSTPPPMQMEKAPTTMQGDLLRVNPDAKTVTIQPATGADQEFTYTDDTKVVGGDKGVAGLATMKGSRVTITFKTEGKERVATQIEVHPRSGA
jgi:hypothetical protein